MPRRSNQLLSQGHKTTVFPLPPPLFRCPFHLTGRGCSSLLCATCPCVATIFLACTLHLLPTRSPCSCPFPFPHHPTHPTPSALLSPLYPLSVAPRMHVVSFHDIRVQCKERARPFLLRKSIRYENCEKFFICRCALSCK